MKAKQFNVLYPVGTIFRNTAHSGLRGAPLVMTTSAARDFKCGCIVEINKEPYFVKVETLQKAG